MRIVMALACALALSACMQETVRFHAKPSQQAVVRDGQPALVSEQKNSLVMIRSATRQFASGGRPVFVVGVHNLTKQPINFQVRNIAATQIAGDSGVPMKVHSYEDLVAEERTAQVMTALLVGAAAGANTALASQAAYRTKTTTVYGPTGSYTYQTSTYSPSRAAAAHNRAMRTNVRLIDAAIKDGQANLAALEREVIKDNTLMPGEWYGGMLHLAPPADAGGGAGPKRYSIALTVGPDRHEIDVVQESVK
jgi:hypothetical protein